MILPGPVALLLEEIYCWGAAFEYLGKAMALLEKVIFIIIFHYFFTIFVHKLLSDFSLMVFIELGAWFFFYFIWGNCHFIRPFTAEWQGIQFSSLLWYCWRILPCLYVKLWYYSDACEAEICSTTPQLSANKSSHFSLVLLTVLSLTL